MGTSRLNKDQRTALSICGIVCGSVLVVAIWSLWWPFAENHVMILLRIFGVGIAIWAHLLTEWFST